MTKVAVVTGGNKVFFSPLSFHQNHITNLHNTLPRQGIGYEICIKLGAAGVKVILATRNDALGEAAAAKLKALGHNVEYRNLDISDDASIARFAEGLNSSYDKLDILINNAAVALFDNDPSPKKGQAIYTMKPNFFGTVRLTDALLPLLRKADAPRIVNAASQLGHLNILASEELKARFLNATTIAEVDTLMKEFVRDWEQEQLVEKGWGSPPYTTYSVSKVGLIAYTRVLAKLEAANGPNKRLLINYVCPGYCATDLNGNAGHLTAEQGARTPVQVALWSADEPEQPNGKFFTEGAQIEWQV